MFKNPQAFLHNVQPGEQVEQEEFNLTPGAYPTNGNGSLHGVYPTNGNGSLQFSAPTTPFPNVPTIPLPSVQSTGIDTRYGSRVAQFKVPTTPSHNGLVTTTVGVPFTPFTGLQHAIVDPRKSDHVERYAQWLQANNNLPASPQKLQAYQDAALEIKNIPPRCKSLPQAS
jgi:hypothetical protein